MLFVLLISVWYKSGQRCQMWQPMGQIPSQNEQKTVLKKSHICLIWWQYGIPEHDECLLQCYLCVSVFVFSANLARQVSIVMLFISRIGRFRAKLVHISKNTALIRLSTLLYPRQSLKRVLSELASGWRSFSGRDTVFISVIGFSHVHYSAIDLSFHQKSIAVVCVVC